MDAIVDSIAGEHRGATIELIKYHMYWPGADGFYDYNPTESNARRAYYGLNYVPWLAVDGTQSETGSVEEIAASIEARLLLPTPLEISVSDTLIGDSVYVTAQVIATDDLDGKATYTFQCAAVEDWRRQNGIKFYYPMRDMVPTAAGESFTISKGDTVTFERVWWMDLVTYHADRMKTLVFVQNPSTKEILNSASTAPRPEHFMMYLTGDMNEVILEDSTAAFVSYAYNLGTVADTFDVNLTSDILPGWSASYTTSQGTFSGPSQIFLDPGQEELIQVNVDPANIPGYGTVEAAVTGLVGTGIEAAPITRPREFRALGQPDVILVDDDGSASLETYFQTALDSTGLVYGTWYRLREQVLAEDLAAADAVVWMTGRAEPTFTLGDRNAVKDYLLGGGNAFVSGQDIGWSLCDLSSPGWAPNAVNWYQTYLGAVYVADDADTLTLYGVASDPITDGMSYLLYGGTGANGQRTHDLIAPNGSAVTIFNYAWGDSMPAAVRLESPGVFKTVYTAFGLEGIQSEQDRADLMRNIMEWFGLLGTTSVAETEALVKPAWLAQNVPNPFNPETEIRFSLPDRQNVRLNVYNVQGQLIQVLRNGIMEAGEHAAHWDGMDRNGSPVASGLYFYALESGDFAASKKMILLR